MKYFLIIIFSIALLKQVEAESVFQKKDTAEIFYGPIHINTVVVRGRKLKGIFRDRTKLERMIAKVYPIAKEANATLRNMEREMMAIPNERKRKEYVKSVEKTLKKKYTPVLMRMTTKEGMILLKLIDRETGDTSYELVKELRGGFSAFFWQNIARLFSVNLKSQYDATGEDKLIEYYIKKYEQNL